MEEELGTLEYRLVEFPPGIDSVYGGTVVRFVLTGLNIKENRVLHLAPVIPRVFNL